MAVSGDTPPTVPGPPPTPNVGAGPRVLILGGTAEARELAGLLIKSGYAPVTALAGITQEPAGRAGDTRIGGFGGAQGLADYVAAQGFCALVDATHPFAMRISSYAKEAAQRTGLPLLRLERPAWTPQPDDRWIPVADNPAAVSAVPAHARVLLTIGRKEVSPYFARSDITGIVRMIEPLDMEVTGNWRVLLARPPFSLEGELRLLSDNSITYLVTKNSGGTETQAKLAAARLKGLPVIMIERPRKPQVPTVADKRQALELLRQVVSA